MFPLEFYSSGMDAALIEGDVFLGFEDTARVMTVRKAKERSENRVQFEVKLPVVLVLR